MSLSLPYTAPSLFVSLFLALSAEEAHEVHGGTIPALEQEFGQDADKTNPEPLLCKQM